MSAADLRRMADAAEEAERAATLDSVCRMVGVGVRAIQSRERTADTAKRRAIVAWILCDRLGWAQARAAKALGRTERQVIRLLQAER